MALKKLVPLNSYVIDIIAVNTSHTLDGGGEYQAKHQKSERDSHIEIVTFLPHGKIDTNGDGSAPCKFKSDLKGVGRDRNNYVEATWEQSGGEAVFYLKSIGLRVRLDGFSGTPTGTGKGFVSGERRFYVSWRCKRRG